MMASMNPAAKGIFAAARTRVKGESAATSASWMELKGKAMVMTRMEPM